MQKQITMFDHCLDPWASHVNPISLALFSDTESHPKRTPSQQKSILSEHVILTTLLKLICAIPDTQTSGQASL